MHGNVWTWCQGVFSAYPEDLAADDKEDIRDVSNCLSNRVLRGGSFDRLAPNVRSSYRDLNRPSERLSTIGVRLSRTYH
jgi:formylglycine-generating enzyme required for sulfatase activity